MELPPDIETLSDVPDDVETLSEPGDPPKVTTREKPQIVRRKRNHVAAKGEVADQVRRQDLKKVPARVCIMKYHLSTRKLIDLFCGRGPLPQSPRSSCRITLW